MVQDICAKDGENLVKRCTCFPNSNSGAVVPTCLVYADFNQIACRFISKFMAVYRPEISLENENARIRWTMYARVCGPYRRHWYSAMIVAFGLQCLRGDRTPSLFQRFRNCHRRRPYS